MQLEPSVLQKLQIAYDIVADVLGQAPQLYDCHLDQALLVLVLSMKRARRSPKLRRPRHPEYRDQELF
jgi:glycerol-3-phosphate O-acyltransferase